MHPSDIWLKRAVSVRPKNRSGAGPFLRGTQFTSRLGEIGPEHHCPDKSGCLRNMIKKERSPRGERRKREIQSANRGSSVTNRSEQPRFLIHHVGTDVPWPVVFPEF